MGGAQRDSRRKPNETETRLDSGGEGWRLKGEGQRAEKKRKQRDTQRQKRKSKRRVRGEIQKGEVQEVGERKLERKRKGRGK